MNFQQPVQPVQTGIRVTKLLIHETGTYNPQFRRSYTTNLDNATMQSVIERVSGADKFKPLLMAGVANQFVMPSATPEKELAVPNGWNERRARFMMEIEHHYAQLGTTIIEVITGYTDHLGITGTGAIDPNMTFYINSTMQIKTMHERTPMGVVPHMQVIDSSQLLADNNFSGIYTDAKDHRMRPEDVYSTMSRLNTELEAGTVDMRTTLTNVAVKSRRANTLPANYMASIMDNHRSAQITQDYGTGVQDVLVTARGLVAENSVVRDPFISAMSQVRGQPANNWFVFRELLQLDPNAASDQVCVIQILGQTHQHEVHHAGQTQYWGGSDRDTHAASVLSQGVPALMMELMLMRIVFKASNHTVGGQIVSQVLDVEGFSNIDMRPYVQNFQLQLEHVLLRDLSFNGQIGFNIEMQVDLLGETWITVQFESDPPVKYVTPSFADALMTPVITSDPQQALNVARDFELLIDNVTQETAGFNGGHSNSAVFTSI